MHISYKPLWHTLLERDMRKEDLRLAAGMTTNMIAKHFGSQVCVVAIDAKQTETGWKCYLNGGRIETDKYLFDRYLLRRRAGHRFWEHTD